MLLVYIYEVQTPNNIYHIMYKQLSLVLHCTHYTYTTQHYIPIECRVRGLDEEVAEEGSEHMGHVPAHGVDTIQHHVLHL